MKFSSYKPLTWKSCFLLALTSDKRVSELYDLSCCVCHLIGWRSCNFSFVPDLIHDPRFEKPTVPLLLVFVDGNRDEM